MKSYVFRVVLEEDEDVWRAFIPELEAKGAATWGDTKEEALRNIREVGDRSIARGRRVFASSHCGNRSASRNRYSMTVDYSKLRSITARRLASAFGADGFEL